MVAILLILFIILLFSALPIWPYSASGRTQYHVVSVGDRTARSTKLPRLSRGETLHKGPVDYTSQFRKLQDELQMALDRAAKTSSQKTKLGGADRYGDSRGLRAA